MTPEEMAAVHARCFPDRPWSATEIDELLNASGVLSFSSPGKDGILLVRIVPPEAEILTLAVEPDARRCGIGSGLVTELLAEARRRCIAEIFLEVAADNRPARALYERQGFVEIGLRKDYYAHADGTRTDAVMMRRAVTFGHQR